MNFWKKYDVFVSYVRKEAQHTEPLVAELRRRGYRVFYDRDEMVYGENWKEFLTKCVDASRVCLLCWSKLAKESPCVNFEYHRAGVKKRKLIPWLLDDEPLPTLVEEHSITETNPVAATEALISRLGWNLSRRRQIRAAMLTLVLFASGAIYRHLHPPPGPWDFGGRVVDSESGLPIAGAEVKATVLETRMTVKAETDRDGRYTIHMPPPQPQLIHLEFTKNGYGVEKPVNVHANAHVWDTDMVRINEDSTGNR